MLSGRRVVDKNRPSGEQNLIEWAKPYLSSKRKIFNVMDARIRGQYSLGGALKAARIAIKCLSLEPRCRPNANELVRALEQLQESEETAMSEAQQNANRNMNAGPKYRRRSANDISDMKPAIYPRPSLSPVHT